jgi:hypothetical protein
MSKKTMPGIYRARAAQAAQKRYLHSREPETKKVERKREATAEVVAMCILVALNRTFGLGESRLQRVADQAGALSKQFDLNNRGVGWAAAKKKLNEDVADVFVGDFVLPVVTAPKKRKDWAHLSEQRDAADTVVKLYIKAARDVLGFGKDRTAAFVQAIEQEYRTFSRYAKDGDYYGYWKLARDLGVILRTEITVDESGVSEPLFGKTLD